MTDKQDTLKTENKVLKVPARGLQKEIIRKDRALAEVVALLRLSLKKKESRFAVGEQIKLVRVKKCSTATPNLK